jgi:hypothetical protein
VAGGRNSIPRGVIVNSLLGDLRQSSPTEQLAGVLDATLSHNSVDRD